MLLFSVIKFAMTGLAWLSVSVMLYWLTVSQTGFHGFPLCSAPLLNPFTFIGKEVWAGMCAASSPGAVVLCTSVSPVQHINTENLRGPFLFHVNLMEFF